MRRQFCQSGSGTCSASCLSFRQPHGSLRSRCSADSCGSAALPPGSSRLIETELGGTPGGSLGEPEWQPLRAKSERKTTARRRSVLECNLSEPNLPHVGDAEAELGRYTDVGGIPTRLGQRGQTLVFSPLFNFVRADGIHRHRVGRYVDGSVRNAPIGVLVERAPIVDELEAV